MGLRIGGFIFLSLQEYRNRISARQKGVYRIMCLGESTTAIGGKNSYPRQVEKILNQRDIEVKFSVINKGVVGADSGEIISQLEDNLNKYNPDMVITMMGINDEACTMPHEDILTKEDTLFFKTFRIYKLTKLLHARIITKLEVIREEEVFKEAIKMNPGNDHLYAELGFHYRIRDKYDKAEKVLKKAIEINPENEMAYRALASLYGELGKCKLAKDYFKKANGLSLSAYNPVMCHNYQRLREIVARKGIKLVCVQYPVRSIEPLKKMLEDKDGIIFVDNEIVFKKALEQVSYDEYFTDMLGGDFGHCTLKGNGLLAKNIANTILKECFLE